MRILAILIIFPLFAAVGPSRICQMESTAVEDTESSHCHETSEKKTAHKSHDNCHGCESFCCHTFLTELTDLSVDSEVTSTKITEYWIQEKTYPKRYQRNQLKPPIS